jgi:hypothetical protein
MTKQLLSLGIKFNAPGYYHREYKNDFKEGAEELSWLSQSKPYASIVIPIALSLFNSLAGSSFAGRKKEKFLWETLSRAMGSFRVISCMAQCRESIKKGDVKEVSYTMVRTGLAVASLTSTVFIHHSIGMVINVAHDLLIESRLLINHLQAGENKKAIEDCLNILNNAFYLSRFFHPLEGCFYCAERKIASIALQTLNSLYHTQKEFRMGNDLRATGQLFLTSFSASILSKKVAGLLMSWQENEAATCF